MRKLLSPIFLSCFATTSYGVGLERSNSNFDIEFVEGNQLSFELDAGVASIDNFLFQQHEEQSTTALSLNPKAFLQTHNESHLLQFIGDVNRRQFDKFDEDDHTNTVLLAKYFYKLAPDHRTFVSFSFDDLYEYRGQGLTKGSAESVDKGDTVENTLVNIGYQYGRVDTVSRLNLLAGIDDVEYQTRRAVTSIHDHERKFLLLDLDYAVAAKTYLTVSMEYSDYEYEHNPVFDKEVAFALAGVKWRLSEASEFGLLVGAEKLTLDTDDSDENKFKWRLNYNWTPVEHIRFSIYSGRATDTKAELGSDYKISDTLSLSANYKFNTFFDLQVGASFTTSEVRFDNLDRDDEALAISSRLNFKYSETFTIYADVNYNEIESDIDAFEYDRSALLIGAKLSF